MAMRFVHKVLQITCIKTDRKRYGLYSENKKAQVSCHPNLSSISSVDDFISFCLIAHYMEVEHFANFKKKNII